MMSKPKAALTALSAAALIVLAGCSGAGNTADLKARVAALEERVGALEGVSGNQEAQDTDRSKKKAEDKVGPDAVKFTLLCFQASVSLGGQLGLHNVEQGIHASLGPVGV